MLPRNFNVWFPFTLRLKFNAPHFLRLKVVMDLRRSSRNHKTSTTSAQIVAKQPEPGSKKRQQISTNAKHAKHAKRKKAQLDSPSTSGDLKQASVLRTPKRARIAKTSAALDPPTPSVGGLVSAQYSTGDIDDATPPPLDRPVEPHLTTATLVTPGGTQAVAYPKQNGDTDQSPSKTGLPRPTATTGDLLDKACKYLVKVDPRMEALIAKHPCRIFSPEGLAEEIDPFRSLVSGIMAQQVSGAAAKSIKNKFIALFQDPDDETPVRFPTPSEVAKTDLIRLRQAGLSQRKAEYIQGLAEKFASGELSTNVLLKASDEEIMEKLIAVRGLGKWSIEMFLLFAMKRMDVWSNGDLGVQRGLAAFMGKDVGKLKAKGGKWKYMSEAEMIKIAARYEPYRGLFMWYMWRVEDVDVDAIQNTK